MRAEAVQALIDAADDLLADKQRLGPHPLPEELTTLTEAYIEKRALMGGPRFRDPGGG